MAVLTAVAFVYAAWLVASRSRLPEPARATGLRRRFYLATLLSVGLFTLVSGTSCERAMCYRAALPPGPGESAAASQAVRSTLRAVWLALDPKDGKEFRRRLETQVARGEVKQRVSELLVLAFSELAYHKERTRGEGPRAECYKMTRLGGTLWTSRENALKQLELLRKAQKSGAIDGETAAKARQALAREVEMLDRAKQLRGSRDWKTENKLAEDYGKGEVKPGEDAAAAASLILELEGVKAAKAPKEK